MKAEIISIGTELLLGEITDTNATHIAQELRKIGLDVIYRTTVGDNEIRIAEVIRNALNRVDVIITTGGLGPTVDDKTREAVAAAIEHPLVFNETLYEQISARFKMFNVKMTKNNRQQAFIPESAIPIENPVGTAPVFIVNIPSGIIAVLPGVPREMIHLLEHAIIPWLNTYNAEKAIILSVTLRTAGIGESQIGDRIADLMTMSNPTVGLAAHTGQTDIRITVKAPSETSALSLIQPVKNELYSRMGDWIYGEGKIPIEEVLAGLLEERKSTLSSIEIGTDGLLLKRLQETVDNSNVIKPSEAYASMSEISSESSANIKELAEELASSIQEKNNSTYGCCIIIEKNVDRTEAAIALSTPSGIHSRSHHWLEDRSDANVWMSTQVLAQLRRLILKNSG